MKFINNNFNFTSRDRRSSSKQRDKVWFSESYSNGYFSLVSWSLDLDYLQDYRHLWKKIISMYKSQNKRNNLRFVFTYLKDVYTTLQFAVAGQEFRGKHWVSVDSAGIPKLVPFALRMKIREGDRKTILGVCTLLGVYRVIAWWPKVSLSTITETFSGLSQSLDGQSLKGAWRLIEKHVKFVGRNLNKPKFLIIRSSGPNGPDSITRVIEDAFAFYRFPGKLIELIKWFYLLKGYLPLISLVLILTLGFPLFLIMGLPRLYLGKLGCVYNVAGKARVVAMTNYWIQVGLKPVHDKIFKILGALESDGTFNQHRCIKRLERSTDKKWSSFDLTAATDRLPLEVQRQVLSMFLGSQLSYSWMQIIQFPLLNPFGEEKEEISYAVGQPMGAYSSWASLALTHHVICLLALKRGGCKDPFNSYAVLGDDMVIDSKYSKFYLETMSTLGVDISLSKSILESSYIEFAKKLSGPKGEDFSILGPGLILQALQNKLLRILLLVQVYERDLSSPDTLVRKVTDIAGKSSDISAFGLNLLLGARGVISKDSSFVLFSRIVGGLYLPSIPREVHELISHDAFGSLWRDERKASIRLSEKELNRLPDFIVQQLNRFSWTARPFVLVLWFVSPLFWLLFSTYWRVSQQEVILPRTKDEIIKSFDSIEYYSLDRVSKQDVRQMCSSVKRLQKYAERSYEELSWMTADGHLHVF